MAVVTIGYVQAGTKENIIPDQAVLGVNVRSFKPDIRKQLLAAIERITKGETQAGGSLREPLIEHTKTTDSVYNEPALAQRLRAPLEAVLTKEHVVTQEPVTASEDFSYFVKQGIPGFYFELGGANPEKFAAAKAAGTILPPTTRPSSLQIRNPPSKPASPLKSPFCAISCKAPPTTCASQSPQRPEPRRPGNFIAEPASDP